MDTIPQDTPQKQCTVCGKTLPATPNFFNRWAKGKDGLRSQCKECTRAQSKEYQSRPEVKKRMHTYHQSWIKEYLNRPGIRQRNSIRNIPYQKAYRQENHERLNQQKKTAYSRPEIREHYRTMHKAYCNRPEIREKLRERNHNRHARKLNAEGTYTVQDMKEQYKRQKGKCYWCQQKIEWGKHHDDHIIPLNRGGTNWPDNLVIACPTCNCSRRDKLPHEWPEGGRLL